MIEFPSLTVVEKRLPKEAFYANLSLTKSIKEKFVSDIDKIWVQNSLTDKILHLDSSAEIKEILVLRLDMRNQNCEPKILETIARQNKHQLIFLLQYESTGMLAVYYHKLYQSPWCPLVNLHLEIMGFTLDEIWTHFLEQIALQYEPKNSETDTLSIDEAAAYFRIGEGKLHKLVSENPNAEYLLWNGNRVQIKRERFERFVDTLSAI